MLRALFPPFRFVGSNCPTDSGVCSLTRDTPLPVSERTGRLGYGLAPPRRQPESLSYPNRMSDGRQKEFQMNRELRATSICHGAVDREIGDRQEFPKSHFPAEPAGVARGSSGPQRIADGSDKWRQMSRFPNPSLLVACSASRDSGFCRCLRGVRPARMAGAAVPLARHLAEAARPDAGCGRPAKPERSPTKKEHVDGRPSEIIMVRSACENRV